MSVPSPTRDYAEETACEQSTSKTEKPQFGADDFFAAIDHISKRLDLLNGKVKELQEENKALRAQTPEPEPTYLKHAPWPNVISYCSTPCLSVQGQRIIGYAMAAGPEFLALRYMEELKARDEQFDKMRDALRDIFSRSAFADESSRESLKFVLREIGARAGGSLPK